MLRSCIGTGVVGDVVLPLRSGSSFSSVAAVRSHSLNTPAEFAMSDPLREFEHSVPLKAALEAEWQRRAAVRADADSPRPSLPAWLDAVRSDRRRLPGPELSRLCEQLELRERAKAKFADPTGMRFTRIGLEQATDEHVGAYKASRFAECDSVADLCCGIGGDLRAMFLAVNSTPGRRLCGVDLDPAVAACAAANVQAVAARVPAETRPLVRIEIADAASFATEDFAAWHIDPDRRPGGRRTTRVEAFLPPAEALSALLARNPNAAWKLAPGGDIPPEWEAEPEREWLGRAGEVRQQVLWWGSLARFPGRRRATVIGAGGEVLAEVIGAVGMPPLPPQSDEVLAYLHEPDPTVIAAGLADESAAALGAAALAYGTAYYVSAAPLNHPAWTSFAVEEVIPLDPKRLKAACRARDLGRIELKKRGVPIDLDDLRKRLGPLSGTASATLFAAPVAGRVRGIFARRLTAG